MSEVEEIKQESKFKEIKQKFLDNKKKYIIIIIVSIVVLGATAFASYKYSQRNVEEYVEGLRAQWTMANEELIKEIARKEQEYKELEKRYKAQKESLREVKEALKKRTDNVFKSNDKEKISEYFDSTIDRYVPER